MEKGEAASNIREIRDEIDNIDFQIISLLGERNSCVEKIVRFKTGKADVIAKKRQEEIIISRRALAERFGLNPDLIEKIYRILIKNNIQKELEILEQKEIIK
jgi:chorismate mutase